MRTNADSTPPVRALALTKVTTLVLLAGVLACAPAANAQQAPAAQPAAPADRSAAALYRQLSALELDPARVYDVREASIVREDVHITLTEGTIAFLRALDGRVTGAFFDGEGEVMVVPPDMVERGSLALFTKHAVLQDKFTTAYFRFYDDRLMADLGPQMRPAAEPVAFVERWSGPARVLSATGALRLLMAYTHAGFRPDAATPAELPSPNFIQMRCSGGRLGTFDLSFDTDIPEEITAGQVNLGEGRQGYDLWLSFPRRSARARARGTHARAAAFVEPISISAYSIRTSVLPPTRLEAEATITAEVERDGDRTLLFELSRNLKVSSVRMNGTALESVQNEAIPGTELAQRGNDLVAVVLPRPIRHGEKLHLQFTYAGDGLAEAGNGLVHVGSRGSWYPRRGLQMSNFDLEFSVPLPWTLLATGDLLETLEREGATVSRWRSASPIPIAGFNLGRYSAEIANSREVEITAFAAAGVETELNQRRADLVRGVNARGQITLQAIPRSAPAPGSQLKLVAESAAAMVDFLVPRIGPFPFKTLALTQMPGRSSQGWPGLIFLSSYVFLRPEERATLPASASVGSEILYSQVMIPHETAHQYWGDAVGWETYRDQWISEGVSNYLALMLLERTQPESVRLLLNAYREDLLRHSEEGGIYGLAGPVTLGGRLASARYPQGYEIVVYARGTWLLHMLRHMLRESTVAKRPAAGDAADPDALFFSVLRRVYQRFSGGQLSTAGLLAEFEKVLPRQLRYDGAASLDWFAEGWVNGTGIPSFSLENVRFQKRAGKTVATGTLRQKEASGRLVTSLPVYAVVAGRQHYAGRVFADGEESDVRLEVPAGATRLLLDPHQVVLRKP